MITVLVAVAVILGLLVLLLAVPVNVTFELSGIEPLSGQVRIRALLGLMQFRIPIPVAQEALAPSVSRRSRSRGGGGPSALDALRQAAFRQRVYRLVRDLFVAAHLQQVHLRMRLGLGDPADTGLLWAFVGPLNALAQSMPNADVGIEPDFMEPVCEFEVHGRLMLIPLQLLTLAIAFALSPTSIRVWRTL